MGEFEQYLKREHGCNGDVFIQQFGSLQYLRIKDAWQNQQSKIEQLEKEKTALHNAFVYMDECRKEWHEGYMRLHKQKTEITQLVQSLRNEFDLNSDCPQVERQIELLEKALRGECE